MRFVAKAQESRERDANMMMRGFVKIQTAKVLCLRLQCLERIRADVLKFTTGTEGQVNRMSDFKITKCTGEGQGSCKRCSDNGKWNRSWMCFLYKIEGYEGCYCSECVKKIMEGNQNE